jgi:hypothetical protein
VNFLGHLEVARRIHGHDPAVLLGSMLPDLGAPARLKVGPLDGWPAAVARGIECHRRADDAFHADPRFLAGMTGLREELGAAGVARGAARGAAHVGWELLLDGVLLDRPEARAAYLACLDEPADGWPSPWPTVVARYRERGLPAAAMDADAVARRVIDLLAGRPRLAVDPGAHGAVAAAFGSCRARVAEQAEAVVQATCHAVAH